MVFRRISADNYIEYFLVSAISAVLLIRLFLELTGYPQVGGDSLHIAHMLWGGLLMLVSIILLLSFMGRAIENISAVIGGIGFGTFIDEIGKFLTKDNDYFFQPSVALIYLIFITIYLAARAIQRRSEYSPREYLANALRELEELAMEEPDQEAKNRVLDYLNRSGHQSSLSEDLKHSLSKSTKVVSPSANMYQQVKGKIHSLYLRVAKLPVFKYGIIAFFLFQFITQLIFVITLIFFTSKDGDTQLSFRILKNLSVKVSNLSFLESAELLSVLISGIFIFAGTWRLPKSRLNAYRMYERSILVSIFITQVFIFYKEQFGALVGLAYNLIILAGIKFLIRREADLTRKSHH